MARNIPTYKCSDVEIPSHGCGNLLLIPGIRGARHGKAFSSMDINRIIAVAYLAGAE